MAQRNCRRMKPTPLHPISAKTAPADNMTRVTLGKKSRMRESRTSGSVGAKAEWLSYSTATLSTGTALERVSGTCQCTVHVLTVFCSILHATVPPSLHHGCSNPLTFL